MYGSLHLGLSYVLKLYLLIKKERAFKKRVIQKRKHPKDCNSTRDMAATKSNRISNTEMCYGDFFVIQAGGESKGGADFNKLNLDLMQNKYLMFSCN